MPHKIVGGGATGIATIIYYLSDEQIPIALSYITINALLIGVAVKILGPKFGVKAIFGIISCSLLLGLWQPLFADAIWVTDKFMSTIIAGIVNGVGIAMAISHGGSTGGTDIIALIITKFKNVSTGKVLMYCDAIIIVGTLTINPSIEGLMFGYVVMGVSTYVIDIVLSGLKQSAQLFIFTDKYEEVAANITHHFQRGVTVVDCVGWYTGQSKKMLIIVVRKSEAHEVLKIAKREDPNAFMTMNTVMGVFGKGFEEVKGVKQVKEP
ncbi:membrane protein [Bacteroidia bacterium]|nr:membrane protein [Bacteroidia bacterium]